MHERRVADGLHAIWDDQAILPISNKRPAVVERTVANLPHAVSNHEIHHVGAPEERVPVDYIYRARNVNALEAAAMLEGAQTDIRKRIG